MRFDVSFLLQDPVGQIEKLDQFLGYNRGRKLCEQIADACSFTKMKSAKADSVPEEIKKIYFKDNAVGFYRKGETSHARPCGRVKCCEGGYCNKDDGNDDDDE